MMDEWLETYKREDEMPHIIQILQEGATDYTEFVIGRVQLGGEISPQIATLIHAYLSRYKDLRVADVLYLLENM